MTSWIWLGGCLLGWFGLELVQHRFFPGEPSRWGWWRGRTRRREKQAGDGPILRAVPHNSFSALVEVHPAFREVSEFLSAGDRFRAEKTLRTLAAGENTPATCLMILLFQAELFLVRGRSIEAADCLEEVRRRLESSETIREEERKAVAERLGYLEAVTEYRDGSCQRVWKRLRRAEREVGYTSWNGLLQAETALLEGRSEVCRRKLKDLERWWRDNPDRADSADRTAHKLIEAESYLRDRWTSELKNSLRSLGGMGGMTVSEQSVRETLCVEFCLMEGNPAAAWRHVGRLFHLVHAEKSDRSVRRLFQLSCARVHAAEGNYPETHRRLQLAENEAVYPVVRWEVETVLGTTLETEGRTEEARSVWRRIEKEASETYFGHVARSRLDRYRKPRPVPAAPVASAPRP